MEEESEEIENAARKHKQLQRDYQCGLTIAMLAIITALVLIGGGVAWILLHLW